MGRSCGWRRAAIPFALLLLVLAACGRPAANDKPRQVESVADLLREVRSELASGSASFEARYDSVLFGRFPMRASTSGEFGPEGYEVDIDVDDGYDHVQRVVGLREYVYARPTLDNPPRWSAAGKAASGRNGNRNGFFDPRSYLDMLRVARLSKDGGVSRTDGVSSRRVTLILDYHDFIESLLSSELASDFPTAGRTATLDLWLDVETHELHRLRVRDASGGTYDFQYRDWGRVVHLSVPEGVE